MNTVKISFDESIPLINIIRGIAAMGCTLRGDRGSTVVAFPELARCD